MKTLNLEGGDVAQLGERILGVDEVVGSSPIVSTTFLFRTATFSNLALAGAIQVLAVIFWGKDDFA